MAELHGIYKCGICGNVVEVLYPGGGELVCCGQPMQMLQAQTADSSTEKHVPLVEQVDGGFLVKVGSVPHPMVDKHYITLIELETEGGVHRRFLSPGMAPEAFFRCSGEKVLGAREYCNVHGLWKG